MAAFQLSSAMVVCGETPFLPVKLDEAMDLPSVVRSAWLMDGGEKILYTSDHEKEQSYSIYLATFPGGESVKINVPEAPEGVTWSAWYSSEFDRVLCSWNSSGSSLPPRKLYSAPGDGGPSEILIPLYPVSAVRRYELSEAAGRVIYASDGAGTRVFHLYSVPIEGGEILKLTDQPVYVPNDYEQPFEVSGDGNIALYRALSESRQLNLHRVALGGGLPERVNPPLEEGQVVQDFEVCDDGSSIAFVIKDFGADESMLFTAPADGSSAPMLVHSVGDDSDIGGLVQNVDGSIILFLSDSDEEPGTHLFSCRVETGTITRLSPALDGWIVDHSILPGGRVLMHLGNHDHALAFSNLMEGGDLRGLTSELGPDVTLVRKSTRVTPDGQFVVMVALNETSRATSLHSYDLRTKVLKRLDRAEPGAHVGYVRMSPDGQRMVYQELLGPDESRLISVPVEGGSAFALHLPNPEEADVTNLQLGDGNGLAIYGEYTGSSRYRYYMTPYHAVDRFPVFAEFFDIRHGFDGDDDMDRIPNGVEYCLNSNPRVANDFDDWAYVVRRGGNQAIFSLKVGNQMPSDVEFAAEVLGPGGGWSKVAHYFDGMWSFEDGYSLRDLDEALGTIRYRGAEPSPGSFLFRLNAELKSEVSGASGAINP